VPEELGERTESPSGRKRSEARAKGQVAKSADLSAAIDLIGAMILLAFLGSGLVAGLTSIVANLLDGRAFGPAGTGDSIPSLLSWTAERTARTTAPFLVLMFMLIALGQFLQVGWLYTLEPLKPNLSRLNPLNGMKRLTGRRNVVKTATSIVKLVVVGGVAVSVIASSASKLAALPSMGVIAALFMTGSIVVHLAAWVLAVMLAIGLADFVFQRWQHTSDLQDDQAGGQGGASQHGGRHGYQGPGGCASPARWPSSESANRSRPRT
jgi:flagellar biosynthetic protein FlhB